MAHRAVARHLLDTAELEADEGHGGCVTLIQRFGSAANLNIHLLNPVLDGLYRCGADGEPTFVEVGEPTDDERHALLQTGIDKPANRLTRRGVLGQDMGRTGLTVPDAESAEARRLRPLQAAAINLQGASGQRPGSADRIAFGPRAGHKVPSLRGAAGGVEAQDAVARRPHALGRERAGVPAAALGADSAAAALHLIRLHGVLAPLAKLRAGVVLQGPSVRAQAGTEAAVAAECEIDTTRARPGRISRTRLLERVSAAASLEHKLVFAGASLSTSTRGAARTAAAGSSRSLRPSSSGR